MALDVLSLICKRREDSFLLINNEGGDSPSHAGTTFSEGHEVDDHVPSSPRHLREHGSSSGSGGSGQGADENQPRHANVDRVDAMRRAAQQAAIREQVANEMETACKSMSMQRIASMTTVMSPSMSKARTSSPFAGPRAPLVQQPVLSLSRTPSMTSTTSFATQSLDTLRAPSSDSFRSTSSFRSASAMRARVQSPRPARPAARGSSSQQQRPMTAISRRPHESPLKSPGLAGPGRAMPDTLRFSEADSFRASTPQRQDSSARLAGPQRTTPQCSSGQLERKSNAALSGGGIRPGAGRTLDGRTSRPAHNSGRTKPQEGDDDAAAMSKRLNVAADIIDGLVFDSTVLEEARRTVELAREADALSARTSPEKISRRSRSCNVFWRPPPEAARVCETARSTSLSRPESLDVFSGGGAVHRTSSENSRPLSQVLGMGCGGLVREDSWGTPVTSLSFLPMQGRCGATSKKPPAWQAQAVSSAPRLPAGAPAAPTISRQRRNIMLSPRTPGMSEQMMGPAM